MRGTEYQKLRNMPGISCMDIHLLVSAEPLIDGIVIHNCQGRNTDRQQTDSHTARQIDR